MKRTPNCQAKLNRMNKALHHEEPDTVPVSDFFWGSFVDRWRKDMSLPSNTDIFTYYNLDWTVTIPNMDPHIKDFEVIDENKDYVIVRTGFEAIVKKKFKDPMPAFLSFKTDTMEKVELFQYDDPWDNRRYFSYGDNQISGVGDSFIRDSPAWIETVRSRYSDFPVYGSVCEANEILTRLIGKKNLLFWLASYPQRF